MGCLICLQERYKFFCNMCVKESIFEYINVKNNIILSIPSIKEIVRDHHNKKITQLKTILLKEQLVQFRLRCYKLANKIAEYKLKNKDIKTQSRERKLKLEIYNSRLNNLIEQFKSAKEFFTSKIKEVDIDTQIRSEYTRRGLVCQLYTMVYFCPVNYSVFQRTEKIVCCKKITDTPKENYMQITQTESSYFRFYSQFGGGVLHFIRIVSQISQYLGKILPFSVVYRGSIPYIEHGFTRFQNISDIPLFLLDKIQDLHPLLVAISFYNLAYLCFTQSIDVTYDNHLKCATGSWTSHLQQLFKVCQHKVYKNIEQLQPTIANTIKHQEPNASMGCCSKTTSETTSEATTKNCCWWNEEVLDSKSVQPGVRITRLRYQLDPGFNFEFKELLVSTTKHLKGNQAWSNPCYTCIDKNLLDDYFIPDKDSSKGEDEPWDIVDVVLPPTPSELHAVGI